MPPRCCPSAAGCRFITSTSNPHKKKKKKSNPLLVYQWVLTSQATFIEIRVWEGEITRLHWLSCSCSRWSRTDCGADPDLFFGSIPSLHNSGLHPPRSTLFFSNCTTALLFGAASCLPHLMQTAADCVEVKSHHGDDLFVQHDDTFQEKHKEFPVLFFCFLSLWLREEEWWNLIGIILNPFLWGRDTHTHAHAHTMYQ